MATRVVTGTVLRANGAPWAGASVKFRPVDDSYTLAPDTSYPITTVPAVTDSDGEFSVTLAAGLSVAYQVDMPDGETFRIVVSEGSATTLELLRAAYDGANPAALPTLDLIVAETVENSAEFSTLLTDIVEGIGLFPLEDLTDVYFTGSPTDGDGLFYADDAGGPGTPGWKAYKPYFGDQANTSDLWTATAGQVPVSDGAGEWLAGDVVPADASTTVKGIVELATTAETTTGTDATRAVTPDGLHDMTSLSGAAWFLDEDDMASDSAVKVPSQQSVKAYAASKLGDIFSGLVRFLGGGTSAVSIEQYSADANPAYLQFKKSHNATPGSNTIVSLADTIGAIEFLGANGTSYTRAAMISAQVSQVPGASNDMPGTLSFWTTPDGSGTALSRLLISHSGAVVAAAPLGGLGYMTGAGGAVTQATSKSTGVTLNNVCGQITMNGAALAAAAEVKFTVTNSAVAATDVVIVNHASGGTAGSYLVGVAAVGSGSFDIVVSNVSVGSLSETIVLNFAVIKAVNA